ncbi:MAG: M24 family metallopeptidase [Halobacteria archaeon]|nr:M24 family metallopeptidase [Halobacteria archaeon]
MPNTTDKIIREKVDQAVEVLDELNQDTWLTFCRETSEIDEPCLPFLLGFDVVWPTMILLTSEGRKEVIIGRHDSANAEELGIYEVHPYDESLKATFLDILKEIDPETVAVNFSKDNNVSDGLTHGMYLRLKELLEDADYDGELVSSNEIVKQVRGVKSETEKERIKKAGEITEELFKGLKESWEPEWTESDIADWFHDELSERGLESAWSWDYCPTVHAGPESEVGHTMPGDISLKPNQVLHMDFGVRYKGYASDLQRVYYYGEEDDVPQDLLEAFNDVRDAIDAGFKRLKPGVEGHEVDSVARDLITNRGWPEYQHALGHQVGRNAHDGGTLLGPTWDRYGDSPYGRVREGEVYTLELGVETEYGYVGQEEMVEITSKGARYLIPPQERLRFLEGT